jgi:hypothetical protein
LENVHKASVGAGDWLEIQEAGELALVVALAFHLVAADDFDGAVEAQGVAREPDLAKAAPADAAEHCVIRNGGGDRRGGRLVALAGRTG